MTVAGRKCRYIIPGFHDKIDFAFLHQGVLKSFSKKPRPCFCHGRGKFVKFALRITPFFGVWQSADTRVFPKIHHSARSDRIVLVEYTTGSVVELNFC